jgi:ElaB/YqjD/DUF883 family membrane-anchored ribosome-binding protein
MTTSAEIMQDVERTRAEIRSTIDELENRVSVEQLVHRFISPAKAGTIEFGHLFSDAVRANPLALGVTAVGLGWLMLGSQKPIIAIGSGNRVRDGNRRLDPNRVDQVGAVDGDWPVDAQADDSASTADQVAGTFRRAGDKFEQVKESARDIAGEAASRVRGAVDQTRSRGAATIDRASSMAHEASDRASSAVREASERASSLTREASQRASSVARDASERASSIAREASATVRQSTSTALHETRKTAAVVGTRIRDAAGRTSGFVREKPIAAGAILVLGGAALALLLTRRTTHHAEDDHDTAPAGMPETPYASGTQAGDDDLHRNPTVALTPEEEGPVYAAGNVSTEAGATAPGGNGGSSEAVADTVTAERSHEGAQSGERAGSEPSDPLDVGKEWPALVGRRTGEGAVDRRQDH